MKPIELFAFNSKQISLYNSVKMDICKKHGIAQTAFDIILFLHNNPKHNTAKEICEIRGIKSGIVSVELEKLVVNGYILKQINPTDRRKHLLFLTDKTKSLTDLGSKMQTKLFEELLHGLNQKDVEKFNEIIEIISQNTIKIEKEGLDFE